MRNRAAPQRARAARTGGWETGYLAALRGGHTKDSAAGLAGVAPRTPYARAERDRDFAEQEAVAYNIGTALLESWAMDRITDRLQPADGILRHLLACRHRSLNPRLLHEVTGAGGGPVEVAPVPFPLEALSLDTRRRMLAELSSYEAREVGAVLTAVSPQPIPDDGDAPDDPETDEVLL